jgi:hypothetical protein
MQQMKICVTFTGGNPVEHDTMEIKIVISSIFIGNFFLKHVSSPLPWGSLLATSRKII